MPKTKKSPKIRRTIPSAYQGKLRETLPSAYQSKKTPKKYLPATKIDPRAVFGGKKAKK